MNNQASHIGTIKTTPDDRLDLQGAFAEFNNYVGHMV
jgi:hypothetical protein